MKDVDEKALKNLERYFTRGAYSKVTLRRWMEIAKEYLIFLENNGKTVDDIGDLLNSEGKVVRREEFGMNEFLDTKTKFSARYMNYLCHAMKTVYEAWDKHFPIPNKKFPKMSTEPRRVLLKKEQMLKMAGVAKQMWLESIKKNPGDIQGLRDYCMVLINIECGARRYQISLLDCDFYDMKKNVLFIPLAKGGRDTYRNLSSVVRDVLLFYLQKRGGIKTSTKAMFLLKNNEKRITPEVMSYRFQKISKRAGVYVRGVGFHAPRRDKTKRLADGGLREDEINDAMGWKKGSKMSHIYINLDQEEVQRKAFEADTIFKRKQEETI